MPVDSETTDQSEVLSAETVSRRRLPVNFDQSHLKLFSHELEKRIPETRFLALHDVRVSYEGILFSGGHMLPESFAFPANMKLWRRRSLLKFFASNYLLKRTRVLEKDVLWITDDWSDGYFHWLTDVLSRLYVMRARLNEFLLLLPGDYEKRDFVTSSLRCFGINPSFTKPDDVILCRKLFMPTHTAPSGHYNHEIIRGVRALLLEALGYSAEQAGSERVYLSRGKARMRKIANEDGVINLLAESGFQVIYAEDLSFEQQVELFSKTRYLVSNHGAGLTNMLFMPEGAALLELRHQTDATNNCYFTLASAIGLSYFYQICPPDNDNQDPHSANLIVDLDALKLNLALLLKA